MFSCTFHVFSCHISYIHWGLISLASVHHEKPWKEMILPTYKTTDLKMSTLPNDWVCLLPLVCHWSRCSQFYQASPCSDSHQYPILIWQLPGTFCPNILSFLIFPLTCLNLHLFRVRIFFTLIACPCGFSEWLTPGSIQQCQMESCFLLDPGYQPFLRPANQVSLLVNCLWIITPQLSPRKFYRIYKYTATKHSTVLIYNTKN